MKLQSRQHQCICTSSDGQSRGVSPQPRITYGKPVCSQLRPAPELPALEVVCMLGEFRSVMSSTPFGHVDRMLNRVGVGVLLHQRLSCSWRSPSPPV